MQRSIQLNPKNALAWRNQGEAASERAWLEWELGRPKVACRHAATACEELQKAVLLKPDDSDHMSCLGLMLGLLARLDWETKNKEKGRRHFTAAFEKLTAAANGSGLAKYWAQWAYLSEIAANCERSGRDAAAAPLWKRAQDLNENFAEFWRVLAGWKASPERAFRTLLGLVEKSPAVLVALRTELEARPLRRHPGFAKHFPQGFRSVTSTTKSAMPPAAFPLSRPAHTG
ncbi:MAG: hypothetical protein HYZ53_12730 [Planctomycetes bacterium]|nr:hypothetical protein [Planctomycetota bacterium]